MQQLSYPPSAPAYTPEQQGFQALAPAAAGAPPPIYMPGQAYQPPYGSAGGYPTQGPIALTQFPMQQQFPQYNSGYSMQQQPQQSNAGYPMQQQYTQYSGPQQYQQQYPPQYMAGQPYPQQMPYSAAMYYPQAPAYQQPSAPGFQYPGAGYSQGSSLRPSGAAKCMARLNTASTATA